MITIFDRAPQDQSYYYLGQLFGPMGSVLTVGPGGGPELLAQLFRTFNLGVLTIGTLILIYTAVVGLLYTAQEGEFLGRNKWHGLWAPLRSILGIAALVPTASGYSFIQVLAMWLIVQGIGFADGVWNTALKYISVAGTGSVPPAIQQTKLPSEMNKLFQGLVCQASAKASYTYGGAGGYYCANTANRDSDFCKATDSAMLDLTGTQSKNNNTYTMGPGGTCGQIMFCDPDAPVLENGKPKLDQAGVPIKICSNTKDIECVACNAQRDVLKNSIVPTLGGIAQQLVIGDYEYRKFRDSTTVAPPLFVQSYCTAQGYPLNQCCNLPVVAAIAAAVTGGGAPKICKELPKSSGDSENTYASEQAMQDVLWPYILQPITGNVNFTTSAADQYVGTISQAVIAAQVNNSEPTGNYKTASDLGWLNAGAFYYEIAQDNRNEMKQANPVLTAVTCNPSATLEQMKAQGGIICTNLQGYRNNFDAAKSLIAYIEGASSGAAQSPQLQDMNSAYSSASNELVKGLTDNLRVKGGGALKSVQRFGIQLLAIGIALYTVITLLGFGLTLATGWSPFVLGTGVQNPLPQSWWALFAYIMVPLLAFVTATFVYGATLAFYVPFIPYIFFTFGAIGWFTSTIEALIAAPLVAIGILTPGGQHEIFGHGHNAIMLIFNLFLRPTLMIFGLISAILLSSVVLTMINSAFLGVANSIVSHGVSGAEFFALISSMVIIGIYAVLVVTALNKCFALIHIIPERVLAWIGHHAVAYGEAESVAAVKGGAEAGAGGALAAGKKFRGDTEATGAAKHKKAGKEGENPKVS